MIEKNKLAPDLIDRADKTLVDLNQAWNQSSSEYDPKDDSVEDFAIAMRYCHLYFNKLITMPMVHELRALFDYDTVRNALRVFDHCWEGEKFVGRYVVEKGLKDEHLRVLHTALSALKSAVIRKGGWSI